METNENINKPFSKAYVLRVTAKHMLKGVDISIRKTSERIEEFAGDKDKSKEVFETLSVLYQMQKMMNDFQDNNKTLFGVANVNTTTE
jgi:hypothetical protein